jgi:hypothetical protein
VVCAVLHAYQNIGKQPMRALSLLKTLTGSPIDQQLIALFKSDDSKIVKSTVQLLAFMLEAFSMEEVEEEGGSIYKTGIDKILEYVTTCASPRGSLCIPPPCLLLLASFFPAVSR